MKTHALLAPGLYLSLTIVAGLFSDAFRSSAADITWTNPNGGSWNVATNWNPSQIPSTNDHAIITLPGTYAVSVNAATTIDRLTLGAATGTQRMTNGSAGSLRLNGEGVVLANGLFSRGASTFTCAGKLKVDGKVIWTGGDWAGAGSTVFNPTAELIFGGNNSTKELTGGQAWINSGRIVFTNITGAGGFLFSRSSAVITNLADGVIELADDGEVMRDNGSRGLVNLGTIRKATGTGTTLIGLTANHGTMEILSGGVRVDGNTTNTGRYTIADGATLEVNDAPTFTTSAIVEGEGNLTKLGSGQTARFEGTLDLGGTNNLGGASLNLTTNSTVLRIGRAVLLTGGNAVLNANSGETLQTEFISNVGTITGGDRIVVSGPMIWSNGNITGSGELLAAGGLIMTNRQAGLILDLGGRTVRNAGHGLWSGGVIRVASGSAVFENLTGGVFDITFDGAMSGSLSIHNFGTLRKSGGTGVCDLKLVRNEGVLEILSGSLGVPNNFEQTGSGKLTVRVAGTAPGTELSQLTFPDPLTSSTRPRIDGCLGVALDAGFVPEMGQTFPILTFPRNQVGVRLPANGRFVCFDYCTILGQGRRLQQVVTSTNVLLEVVAASVEGPRIYHSVKAGTLRLCWGKEFPGFQLESCPDLNTLNWLNLPLPGVPDNDVSIPGPLDEPHRFFRLMKPGGN
ncbi:MAG: hypothetical protein IPK15_05580 [Verrucomicrobia bacterium]|nr:hypothetical protein [Verrucomicrobiota bacterium]